jgi:hypothetical protein
MYEFIKDTKFTIGSTDSGTMIHYFKESYE